MVFSSGVFLILFLPITLLVYYNPLLKNRTFKNLWLLLTSLFFYAWGEPKFVVVLVFSILINWVLTIRMERSRLKGTKNSIFVCLILLDVGILFIFKYLNFTLENINNLLNSNIVIPNIILPVGISFYTFQIISYVIDVYRGTVKASTSLLNVALYVSMFPQLIAGPIVRYSTIYNEIYFRTENVDDFIYGIRRFVIGLGKKAILADLLAEIADEMFFMTNTTGGLTVLTAWIGAIAYSFQIYFDFSGYSDMAIGMGRCLGFHFEENFNYPYLADSVSDFWKRWHISLTNWFRDYVYIPLGGNRCSRKRHIINLFIVWLLTGLWHGANWTFILWGLIYFAVQLLEKIFLKRKKLGGWVRLYTLICVIICWVIFRSESIGDAFIYIGKMFGIGAHFVDDTAWRMLKGSWGILVASMLCCFPWKRTSIFCVRSNILASIVEQIWLVAIFVLAVFNIINGNYSPFVYYNF